MQKNILFESSAVDIVLKYLKSKGYVWTNLKYINKGRYSIVYGTPNIAIIFKKAWYESYGDNGFIDTETGKSETGIGDTINSEDAKLFIKEEIEYIYTLFKDGKMYKISLKNFLDKSHVRNNKEGKRVRSFSIHRYERVNKDGNN